MRITNMPPIRVERPENLTVMMLLNEVSRLFGTAIRSKDPSELPTSQDSVRFILIELSKKDGITQLELSKLTHLKPPTVSVAVVKMENLGYVYRQHDENDLRKSRVFLTPKGRAVHNAKLATVKSIDAKATEELTAEENVEIMRILLKMRKKLFEINGISPPDRDKGENI